MSPLFALSGDFSDVLSLTLMLAMFRMFLRIISFLLLALPIFSCLLLVPMQVRTFEPYFMVLYTACFMCYDDDGLNEDVPS